MGDQQGPAWPDRDGVPDPGPAATAEMVIEPAVAASRRRRWRPVAAVAVVAVLVAAVAVAASGGGGGSPSAVSLITAAASRTSSAGTAHFTATAAVHVDGQPSRSFTFGGADSFADHTTEMTLSVGAVTLSERVIAGVVYLQLSTLRLPAGASWVRITPADVGSTALAGGLASTQDPTQGLQFLTGLVGQPLVVGTDAIDGVNVTHYKVVLDFTSLFSKLGSAAARITPAYANAIKAVSAEVDLAHVPGDAWIDGQDRVRRFSFVFAINSPDGLVTTTETLTFSDFGVPVDVEAPPADQVVPFSTVKDQLSAIGTTTAPTA